MFLGVKKKTSGIKCFDAKVCKINEDENICWGLLAENFSNSLLQLFIYLINFNAIGYQ